MIPAGQHRKDRSRLFPLRLTILLAAVSAQLFMQACVSGMKEVPDTVSPDRSQLIAAAGG